uniref:hypothetical protein n=1 Tax=Allorhizocola rhizosphaerae TaxID=1872709 RepID=UPI001B8B81A6
RGLRTPTGPWLATLSQVLQEPMGGRSAAADPPTERDVPAPARAGHIQARKSRAARRAVAAGAGRVAIH